MAPELEEFKNFMGIYDISSSDDILLYDDFSIVGAARTWWLFQLMGKNTVILNDSLDEWENLEKSTETY